ncbi:hypothetical protein EP20_001045 [Staphylococcus aureus]|nr:hypothetical protein EP20_001045 [Staphylococcus aureus]
MKNGATIILESAWAINSLEVDEAKCSLSGTKAGADMKDGLRIHGEDMGTLYTKHVELENKGVDFMKVMKWMKLKKKQKLGLMQL